MPLYEVAPFTETQESLDKQFGDHLSTAIAAAGGDGDI